MDQVGSRWEGGEGEGPFSGLGREGGWGPSTGPFLSVYILDE